MNVNIVDVFAPSEAQVKKNILGNANLEVVSADGILVVRLSGLTLRKTKNGDYFLSPPSYDYLKNGEKMYRKHYDLFPFKMGEENKEFNNNQKQRSKAITDEIVRLVNNGGTKRTGSSSGPTTQATSSTKPKASEPWG